MKKTSFAVFLDVDGVLNTRTTVQTTPDGHIGIDDARVEILANVMKNFDDVELILSSDWKDIKLGNDYEYLESKLGKYGLKISGQTEDTKKNRGVGINNYLLHHPEIEEYVILDDNIFDFEEDIKLWERLLITNGIENAEFASGSPSVEARLFLEYIKSF